MGALALASFGTAAVEMSPSGPEASTSPWSGTPWRALAASLALPFATTLHMLTVGWITQLILGVAYWMLPPASRAMPRGRPWVMPTAYVLLNAGLLLRVLLEPAPDWAATGALLVVSGLAQWVAAVLAALALWPRVKGAS